MQNEFMKLLAAQEGHFKLESGHHGNLWLDLDLLFLRPGQLQPFIIELARRFARYNPAAVCGPLVGGGLIAQIIAAELGVEFYYTERFAPATQDGLYLVEYWLPASLRRQIHSKEVVIVDDVINAGSAVRATLTEVRAYGARVVAVGALLVLGSTAPSFFTGQNLPIERIAALESNLWTPAECPLCAAHVVLEDVRVYRK
jgi:orotate phosphoribosyltransferase